MTFRDTSFASGQTDWIQFVKRNKDPMNSASTARLLGIGKIRSGCLLLIGHGSKFQNRLGLELTHTFTRNIDLSTDFSQRQRFLSIEAEPEPQDFLLIQLRWNKGEKV